MNNMLRFTKVVFNNQWNLSEEKIDSLANGNKSNAKNPDFAQIETQRSNIWLICNPEKF